MNEECCLVETVARIHRRLKDPLLASSLFWLISRVGGDSDMVSTKELSRATHTSHTTARKIISVLRGIGVIKAETKAETKWKSGQKKYNLSICFEKINEILKAETFLKPKRKPIEEMSPCDIGQVLAIAKIPEPTKKLVVTGPMVNELVAAFCRAYKSRFGMNPEIVGKEQGAARNLIRDLGSVERAGKFVEAYLQMPGLTVKNTYLSWMKPNEVKKFMGDGTVVTRADEQQSDLRTHNMQVANRVIERLRQKEERQYEQATV